MSKGCFNCKHSTGQYKLTNESYYPPIGIYTQCELKISDELKAILPSCFYRQMSILVGHVHPKKNIEEFNDNGSDCLYHELKLETSK